MFDGDEKPQVDQTEQPAPAEETHPTDELVAAQPGTEQRPGATPRVYTEAEFNEKTSTLQKKEAEASKKLAEVNLQNEIAGYQRMLDDEKVKDKTKVEQGYITEEQANQAAASRQEIVTLDLVRRRLTADVAPMTREAAALEIGKDWGVDYKVLLNDTTITSRPAMEIKAARLAVKVRDETIRKSNLKPEKYDKGPTGGVSSEMTEDRALDNWYPTMKKK